MPGPACPGPGESAPPTAASANIGVEMLPELPEHALIAADAGYVGYEYLQAVIASGRHVLLARRLARAPAAETGLGQGISRHRVSVARRAAQKNQPPLVLRLVVAQRQASRVSGDQRAEHSRLTDRQLIDLYRQRWGIELFFRHLKQTFQRRKLRSTSADNARVELEWSLVGLWGMALYAQVELRKHGTDPQRISVAGALRAFRRILRDYLHPLDSSSFLAGIAPLRSARHVRAEQQSQPRLSPQKTT